MSATLPVFLTAFDPAELPGGSLDPVGFTSGYLAIADTLFPGMTAAAAQATYLPMLCAGISLAEAEDLGALSATAARKRRIEVGLRFERLWCLACVLQGRDSAALEDDNGEPGDARVPGLRGIRYVKRELARLEQAGATVAKSEFALLAQQYRYGAFGIYSSVAQALRLLEKSTLALTRGFGDALGRGFLETTADTAERKELTRAATGATTTIQLGLLRSWGGRAFPGAPLHPAPRERLHEGLVHDPVRARTLELLETVANGWTGSTWTDRGLLRQCLDATSAERDPQLFAALEASLAYDAFLRGVLLVFERSLWLCRAGSDAAQTTAVFRDGVVVAASGSLRGLASDLLDKADRLFSSGRRELLAKDRGILEFARRFTGPVEPAASVRAIIERHARIQRGKLERGRPKRAWVEEQGGELVLTSSGIGDRTSEPQVPDDIAAPNWRLAAAVSFLQVTGRIAQDVPA